MKKIKKYIFAFFLTLFLSLLFLEIILRIIGGIYQKTRKNEFLDNKNNWSKKITILTLGDSHTYGGNIKWEQTYSYILWEKLRHQKKDLSISLINKGKCEYNSSQILYELNENLKKYNPDYVIILVGSSDFWNLIDPLSKEDLYIKNPNYDNEQRDIISIMHKNSNNIFNELKIYKFFRLMFLNIMLEKAINKIDDAALDSITSEIFTRMIRSKQHSKVIEYSLSLLKSIPANSVYFSKSLSIFYALSIAYQMQSKYTAKHISDDLEKIAADNPSKKNNEFMKKYIKYFKEKQKYENLAKEKLKSNLEMMSKIIKGKKAVPIFMTYPSEYKIANDIIRQTAEKTNSYLIDLEYIFKNMNIKSDDPDYFDDDEHMNYHGHMITANEIFKFLNTKI